MYALVHVEREGISNDPKVQNSPIVFNIIVETLVLGSVPSSAIPLIVIMVIIVSIFAIAIYKYISGSKLRGD
jgi:hypothetical protein